jgi:hypothetical protein
MNIIFSCTLCGGWEHSTAPRGCQCWAQCGGDGGAAGAADLPAVPPRSPLPMNLGQSCWLLTRSVLKHNTPCTMRDNTAVRHHRAAHPSRSSDKNLTQPRTKQITNQPTPWSRILTEKQTGPQLVKKFPVFYGTQRFTNVSTTACYRSLSWARLIQSSQHPILEHSQPMFCQNDYDSVYRNSSSSSDDDDDTNFKTWNAAISNTSESGFDSCSDYTRICSCTLNYARNGILTSAGATELVPAS